MTLEVGFEGRGGVGGAGGMFQAQGGSQGERVSLKDSRRWRRRRRSRSEGLGQEHDGR